MDDLLDGRLVDAAAAVRDRAVSATELTRACLDRIADRDAAIGAFLHVEADAALAAAGRADAADREGAPLGPLHGVPVARKDLFDRKGQIATCGAWMLRDRRAEQTATVLARLDTAGAIDLGGLTLSEFAFHVHGANRLGGPPRNPWDRERIAGGSSGGSAAALAARLVFGSMGSDSGGSIRSPAALCGVVGLVPTAGRVSRSGMMISSPTLDVAGPMARCVRDTARLFDAVAGHDRADPGSDRRGAPHAEARLDQSVGAVTVAVPAARLLETLTPCAREAVERADDRFREFGWETVER
ncbi:MAG: amidase, partial [Bauldia litoralis]